MSMLMLSLILLLCSLSEEVEVGEEEEQGTNTSFPFSTQHGGRPFSFGEAVSLSTSLFYHVDSYLTQ